MFQWTWTWGLGDLIWYCNLKPSDNSLKHIQNAFIYTTVTSWLDIQAIVWTIMNKLFGITLVYESLIVPFFWKTGIKCLKDTLSTSGDVLTCLQFKEKYNCNINFSLVYAIPLFHKNGKDMLRCYGRICIEDFGDQESM